MATVDADTITDEQINTLKRAALEDCDIARAETCMLAMDRKSDRRRFALEVCAAAYNARHAGRDLP